MEAEAWRAGNIVFPVRKQRTMNVYVHFTFSFLFSEEPQLKEWRHPQAGPPTSMNRVHSQACLRGFFLR